MLQGTIIRVAGPVVDVQFAAGKLPALQEALTVTAEGTERTMEVTQHVNETTVRCIMLSASEGLGKGMTVQATGHGLTAPVGEATLGRMFDPLGRPIDGKGPVDDVPHWPIHRKAPSFAEQKPATEILETGIKVVDLLCPYQKGGKTGLFMDGFFYCDKMSFQCKVGDRLDKAAVGSRMCRPLFLRADRVRSNHGVWTLVDGEHILFRQGKVTCHAGEIVFQKQVKIGIKSIFAEEVGIFLNCFSHSVRCFWRGGDQKICRLSLDRRKKRSEP